MLVQVPAATVGRESTPCQTRNPKKSCRPPIGDRCPSRHALSSAHAVARQTAAQRNSKSYPTGYLDNLLQISRDNTPPALIFKARILLPNYYYCRLIKGAQGKLSRTFTYPRLPPQEAQKNIFYFCFLLFLMSLGGSFVWLCPCGCGWCTATRHPGVIWYTARSCAEQRGLVSQTSQHCKGKGYRTGQDWHQMAPKREFD